MFGWEFPPFKSGGLGTACRDLVKGLVRNGTDVTFVMPNAPAGACAEGATIIGSSAYLSRLKIRTITSILGPYQTAPGYQGYLKHLQSKERHLQSKESKEAAGPSQGDVYGKDLFEETLRYSLAAFEIASEELHDVIHCHDWMTYQAGINARSVSGKPLVVHLHATEFDRTGGNPNHVISNLEWQGLNAADLVIANSNFTKQNIMRHYLIPEEKIKVVHWGIDQDNPSYNLNFCSGFPKDEKIVLFLGRVTLQKGPDYFVEVARKVLDFEPSTRFVMAGSGDMLQRMINRTADLGMADRFHFTGFLQGDDVNRAFHMADLCVMPSVSEPFGLVALESLKNNTPVLVSKQSGVSEVLHHALKVDFWDINEMTNKIVSVLRHAPLKEELRDCGHREAGGFTIDEPARKTIASYHEALGMIANRARAG